MKIEVTSKSQINPNDIPFLSDEQTVLIGKDDKTISLLDKGQLISLLPQSEFTKIDSNNGYLKIPIVGGVNLILQWGTVNAPVAASTNYNYHIPYIDAAFIVFGSLGFTSTDTTVIKADKVSNTQFKIRNADPTTIAKVFWLSIGI